MNNHIIVRNKNDFRLLRAQKTILIWHSSHRILRTCSSLYLKFCFRNFHLIVEHFTRRKFMGNASRNKRNSVQSTRLERLSKQRAAKRQDIDLPKRLREGFYQPQNAYSTLEIVWTSLKYTQISLKRPK